MGWGDLGLDKRFLSAACLLAGTSGLIAGAVAEKIRGMVKTHFLILTYIKTKSKKVREGF